VDSEEQVVVPRSTSSPPELETVAVAVGRTGICRANTAPGRAHSYLVRDHRRERSAPVRESGSPSGRLDRICVRVARDPRSKDDPLRQCRALISAPWSCRILGSRHREENTL
jgi:hypothetical protein